MTACSVHPFVDASAVCFRCEVPLCESCARLTGLDRRPMCERCRQQHSALRLRQARRQYLLQGAGVLLSLAGVFEPGLALYGIAANAVLSVHFTGRRGRVVSVIGVVLGVLIVVAKAAASW